jgi:ketosteroid isomerase-like protein
VGELWKIVRRLDDERLILRTLYRYTHSIDTGDLARFLDCFLQDAVWESTRYGLLGRGHSELEWRFKHHTHAPETIHKHMMSQPIIDVDGDEATVVSYGWFLQVRPTGPFVSHFNTYRDRLRRCDDGVWRFSLRVIHGEAVAPGDVSPLVPETDR